MKLSGENIVENVQTVTYIKINSAELNSECSKKTKQFLDDWKKTINADNNYKTKIIFCYSFIKCVPFNYAKPF